MKKKQFNLRGIALVIVLITGIWAGAFSQPLSQEDRDAINRLYTEYANAIKNSDTEAAMATMADQAVEIFASLRSNIGISNIRHRYNLFLPATNYTQFETRSEWLEGIGSIAVTWGRAVMTYYPTENEEPVNLRGYAAQILRKQADGEWKFLAAHFRNFPADQPEAPEITEEDKNQIRQLLEKWERIIVENDPDELVIQLAGLYSDQAIEIFPSQISNVGKPNLISRWKSFVHDYNYVENDLGTRGIHGVGDMAVAYGKQKLAFHSLEEEDLTTVEANWAMVLTKDQDQGWKILAIHWMLA